MFRDFFLVLSLIELKKTKEKYIEKIDTKMQLEANIIGGKTKILSNNCNTKAGPSTIIPTAKARLLKIFFIIFI